MPVHQVFLYHETDAPEGARFYSDDLPEADQGWVDNPNEFASYQGPPVVKDAGSPERQERTKSWRYHPSLQAKLFWSDEALPPDWYDTPTEARGATLTVAVPEDEPPGEPEVTETEIVTAPMRTPGNSRPPLDAFMEQWEEDYVTDDMGPVEKTQKKKEGIAYYANFWHDKQVNQGQRMDQMIEEVLAL